MGRSDDVQQSITVQPSTSFRRPSANAALRFASRILTQEPVAGWASLNGEPLGPTTSAESTQYHARWTVLEADVEVTLSSRAPEGTKIRFLKFYRCFNRFAMKCFFHEALMYFRYLVGVCIIDNTNLARLRGTGKNAVMVPEREEFASRYGFRFVCHEVNHSNRKAGNERSFFTTLPRVVNSPLISHVITLHITGLNQVNSTDSDNTMCCE